MVTLAKRGDLHARRQALAVMKDKALVHKLFEEAPDRFGDRAGGYTDVIKIGRRRGDAAPISLVALVAPKEKKQRKKKKSKAEKKGVDKAKKEAPVKAKERKKSKEAEAAEKASEEAAPKMKKEAASKPKDEKGNQRNKSGRKAVKGSDPKEEKKKE
jgi:large subunit ribosomal protein L17